jgi:AbrB family looped-hinge helix DNA binding protein
MGIKGFPPEIIFTPNGRMSLPADVRKRLGLTSGGALLVEETPDGLILRTVAHPLEGFGDWGETTEVTPRVEYVPSAVGIALSIKRLFAQFERPGGGAPVIHVDVPTAAIVISRRP